MYQKTAKLFLILGLISFSIKAYGLSNQKVPSQEQNEQKILKKETEVLCPTPPSIEPAVLRKIYRGVDKIVLYVPRLWTYERAVECHDKESQCVVEESKGIARSTEEIESNIISLKKNFSTFPSVLYHKNLLKLFKTRIENGIIPFLRSDKSCTPPEFKIIKNGELSPYSNDPFALHIIVQVRIFENTNPKIAVMGFRYYRHDLKYLDIGSELSLGNTIAIPLNENSEEIENVVNDFVNNPRNISPFTIIQ